MESSILNEAAALLLEKGTNFTMAELSTTLKMSKKTLYKYFKNKEDLLDRLVDFLFIRLRKEKNEFMEQDLPLIQQLKLVLKHHPEFLSIHYSHLHELQYTHPSLHKRIINNINADWESTNQLIEKCIRQKQLKTFDLTTFQLTITALYEKRVNDEANMSIQKLNECIDWIIEGVMI